LSIGTYLSRARKDRSPRRARPLSPMRAMDLLHHLRQHRGDAILQSLYTVTTKETSIYVRRTMSRGRGPYFQLVRSYREEGKVKQEVLVHLGIHESPEDALAAWPSEVGHLRKIGRVEQADKLEANLEKLRALTEAEKGKG